MKHFPESEFIINADGSVFHLHLQPEQLRAESFTRLAVLTRVNR